MINFIVGVIVVSVTVWFIMTDPVTRITNFVNFVENFVEEFFSEDGNVTETSVQENITLTNITETSGGGIIESDGGGSEESTGLGSGATSPEEETEEKLCTIKYTIMTASKSLNYTTCE